MRKSFYIIATLILATGVLAEVNWEVVPESTNVVSKDPVQLKITATWSGYETMSPLCWGWNALRTFVISLLFSLNSCRAVYTFLTPSICNRNSRAL